MRSTVTLRGQIKATVRNPCSTLELYGFEIGSVYIGPMSFAPTRAVVSVLCTRAKLLPFRLG